MMEEVVTNINIITTETHISIDELTRTMSLLKSDLVFCYELLELMYSNAKYLTDIFVSDEIISQFVPMANYFIKTFLNDPMTVTEKKTYGHKPEKIIELFCKTYLEISSFHFWHYLSTIKDVVTNSITLQK